MVGDEYWLFEANGEGEVSGATLGAMGLRPIKKQFEYSRKLCFVAGAVPSAVLNPTM